MRCVPFQNAQSPAYRFGSDRIFPGSAQLVPAGGKVLRILRWLCQSEIDHWIAEQEKHERDQNDRSATG